MTVTSIAYLSWHVAKTLFRGDEWRFPVQLLCIFAAQAPGGRIIKGGWGLALSEVLRNQHQNGSFDPTLPSVLTYDLTCFAEVIDC